MLPCECPAPICNTRMNAKSVSRTIVIAQQGGDGWG
jgi:hypothetical protein